MKSPKFKNRSVSKVYRTILSHGMLRKGDAVLVGLSGGPDSTALLHILHAIAPVFSVRLGTAHLNHGLRRGDAERDAAFAASVSEKLNLPFFKETIDVRQYARSSKMSLEEASRKARYDFFFQTARKNGYNRIAVGHHSDDNAELVLMFLLRGSGPPGISGIPPSRDGGIIRPLIDLKRSEILDYLSRHRLAYVSDNTNADLRYFRNRIRHRLIPHLKALYNPKTPEVLHRLSGIVRQEDNWAEELLEPVFNDAILERTEHGLILNVTPVQRMHIAVQRRIVRRAITLVKGDLRRIGYAHIEAVLDLLATGSRNRAVHLPQRVLAQRDGSTLSLQRSGVPLRSLKKEAFAQQPPLFAYTLHRCGTVIIDEIGCSLTVSEMLRKEMPDPYPEDSTAAFVDGDRVAFPLTVRNFRAGDRFRPLGASGSQKVKKFFIDHKIEPGKRLRTPIVSSRDGIVWVGALRIDDGVRLTAASVRVLKLEIRKLR